MRSVYLVELARMDEEHLDCCASPKLENVKRVYDSSHDFEAVVRCTTCGAHWFYRWHEMIDFDGGPDPWTVWYTRLS